MAERPGRDDRRRPVPRTRRSEDSFLSRGSSDAANTRLHRRRPVAFTCSRAATMSSRTAGRIRHAEMVNAEWGQFRKPVEMRPERRGNRHDIGVPAGDRVDAGAKAAMSSSCRSATRTPVKRTARTPSASSLVISGSGQSSGFASTQNQGGAGADDFGTGVHQVASGRWPGMNRTRPRPPTTPFFFVFLSAWSPPVRSSGKSAGCRPGSRQSEAVVDDMTMAVEQPRRLARERGYPAHVQ